MPPWSETGTYEDEGAIADGAEELHELVKVGHGGGDGQRHADHERPKQGPCSPLDDVRAGGMQVEAHTDVLAKAVHQGLELEHDRSHGDRVREDDVGRDDHGGHVRGPAVRQGEQHGRLDVVAVNGVGDHRDGQVHARDEHHADRERAAEAAAVAHRLFDMGIDGVAAKGKRHRGKAGEEAAHIAGHRVWRRGVLVGRQVDKGEHDDDDDADGGRQDTKEPAPRREGPAGPTAPDDPGLARAPDCTRARDPSDPGKHPPYDIKLISLMFLKSTIGIQTAAPVIRVLSRAPRPRGIAACTAVDGECVLDPVHARPPAPAPYHETAFRPVDGSRTSAKLSPARIRKMVQTPRSVVLWKNWTA